MQDHINHIRQVFERFYQYGMVINPIKRVFCRPEVTFLRHHVSADGISTASNKIKSIQEVPVPINMKQLRWILGLMNFLP